VSPEALVIVRSNECGVRASEVRGRSRRPSLVRLRAWIAAELRYEWKLSLPAIGKLLGGRDHTTVMNYLGMVQR